MILIPSVFAETNNTITIGPEDSIQDAIDNASDNAIIFLNPGIYYQSNIHVDKDITIRGSGSADEIIIDGQYKAPIILINSISTVKISNITFTHGKSSEHGGAIHGEKGAKIYIDNCTFINNTANQNGGAVSVAGYSIGYIYGTKVVKGYLEIHNSKFIDNYAGHDGGGINTYCGDSYIYDSLFMYNYAYRDGGATRTGVYSTTHLERCSFYNNTAREWGGALYNWPGELTVSNCSIANNTAGTRGGAVITSGPLKITDSLIANNKGLEGTIVVEEEMKSLPSRVIMNGNTIIDNYAEDNSIIRIDSTSATNSNYENNYWGDDNPNFSTIFKDNTGTLNVPSTWIKKAIDEEIDTPQIPSEDLDIPEVPIASNNETIVEEVISAIENVVSNYEIVSNSSSEVIATVDSEISNVGNEVSENNNEKKAYEVANKSTAKKTSINIAYSLAIVIVVFIALIFGYYRYKKE